MLRTVIDGTGWIICLRCINIVMEKLNENEANNWKNILYINIYKYSRERSIVVEKVKIIFSLSVRSFLDQKYFGSRVVAPVAISPRWSVKWPLKCLYKGKVVLFRIAVLMAKSVLIRCKCVDNKTSKGWQVGCLNLPRIHTEKQKSFGLGINQGTTWDREAYFYISCVSGPSDFKILFSSLHYHNGKHHQ